MKRTRAAIDAALPGTDRRALLGSSLVMASAVSSAGLAASLAAAKTDAKGDYADKGDMTLGDLAAMDFEALEIDLDKCRPAFENQWTPMAIALLTLSKSPCRVARTGARLRRGDVHVDHGALQRGEGMVRDHVSDDRIGVGSAPLRHRSLRRRRRRRPEYGGMSATIIPFRGGQPARPDPVLPPAFTREWQEQHLPLIDAAMDLLQADDAEFERRCQTIAETEGSTMLEHLTAQLDRLSGHVGDVVEALAMTAMRIRTTMAGTSSQPA